MLASGPHVLRGMEWYKSRLIAYSLGNFVGYKSLNVSGVSGISGIAQLTRDNDRLQSRLDKALFVIEVQKKVAALLGHPLGDNGENT